MTKLSPFSTSDEFEIWLQERHKWLQTAARQLLDNQRVPNEIEIDTLTELCIDEAKDIERLDYSTVQPGAFATNVIRPKLRIEGLQNVCGVNAIKNGANLSFGNSNISVIYGANGSGKSGFSRLLKQACGSKVKEVIESNVFDVDTVTSKANIEISIDNQKTIFEWSKDIAAIKALRDVHVFDSKSADMYINENNEAAYEPRRMRFLSALITICDRVVARIDVKKQLLVKKIPMLPTELISATGANWFRNLSDSTLPEDIGKICNYTQEHDDERILAESALAQKDIGSRLQVIAKEVANLARVKVSFVEIKNGLSDVQILELISARNEAEDKNKAALEDAEKVFLNAPLEGVGQQTWIALWEKAREYSESHAYKNQQFPLLGTDNYCVLCQQNLTEDGGNRLSQFEAFVKNSLKRDANAAEKKVTALNLKLPQLPKLEAWLVQTSILKIDEEEAKQYHLDILERHTSAKQAKQFQDVQNFDWSKLDEAILSIEQVYAKEERTLLDLQKSDSRKKIEMRIIELKTSQWLFQNRKAIEDEVVRRGNLICLDKAILLARTNALTTKKNELAKYELDAGYQTRFKQELEQLGGKRIPVFPQSKQEGKGKITFGLALQGTRKMINTTKVLSEGEAQIVALSAFLADIIGSGQNRPFVFDDPISSLDQSFEERVVNRLVELSRYAQVIVFTHRLSMLTLIENAVERLEKKATLEKIPAPVTLHIETLRRLGKMVGIVHQLNIRDAKPKKAANRLRDEAIPQLRKMIDQCDMQGYEDRAKSVCSDFRIVMERCVENVMFNDVLRRFRRSVETKGRIGMLAKINSADCALIDDLMTRYSTFEHSQPDELPAELPEFDVLCTDVSSLANWITDFEDRAVA
jgi:energy-coupling factor transporter ATP-binding protein EcfA2